MHSLKGIFILFSMILCNQCLLSSIPKIQANPIVTPNFGSLQFGISSLDSNLRHLESIVEIDVFDFNNYANGTYWLHNYENVSCEIPIIFAFETGKWYSFDNINISANGNIIEYDFYEEYTPYLSGYIFNLTFNPNSTVCLNIQWAFSSGEIMDYTRWLAPTTEKIRFYYTGYTINGGKYWNNQSINQEKVIFTFHTERFFVEDNYIVMNITNYRIDNNEFSSLTKRQAFISKIEKFPVETTSKGYQFTLEFTEILDNIYITIVNDNSQIILSVFGYIEIIITVGIIAIIGRRIWKKNMKQAIEKGLV